MQVGRGRLCLLRPPRLSSPVSTWALSPTLGTIAPRSRGQLCAPGDSSHTCCLCVTAGPTDRVPGPRQGGKVTWRPRHMQPPEGQGAAPQQEAPSWPPPPAGHTCSCQKPRSFVPTRPHSSHGGTHSTPALCWPTGPPSSRLASQGPSGQLGGGGEDPCGEGGGL